MTLIGNTQLVIQLKPSRLLIVFNVSSKTLALRAEPEVSFQTRLDPHLLIC